MLLLVNIKSVGCETFPKKKNRNDCKIYVFSCGINVSFLCDERKNTMLLIRMVINNGIVTFEIVKPILLELQLK